MKKILFFLFIVIFSSPSEFEYVYPVGMIDEHTIFFIYQKDCNDLQLWSLDLTSKELTQQLPAMYTPAGFQLLPDGQSFSFIDNGRIRLKSLCKRSPKVIELDRPLYEISLIHWIDNNSAYLSAKYHDHFGIFEINTDGDVHFLLHDHMHDYLYPQKVGNYLFYIEQKRNEKKTHAIKRTLFSNTNFCEELLFVQDKSIAYLHMIHEKEGFFVSYSATERLENYFSLACHHFFQADNQWKTEKLYSFTIPEELLFLRNTRLYESLLPLLPTYIDSKIYFSSCDNESMNIYEYNLSSKIQNCIAQSQSTHIFKPLLLENSIIFGGQVSRDKLVTTKFSNFFNLNTIIDEI